MLKIISENKKLLQVLVHKPGKELLYLDEIENNLIDGTIDLDKAIIEHDEFVKTLQDNNIDVVYIEDLLTDIFENNRLLRKTFVIDLFNNEDLELLEIEDSKEFVLKCIEKAKLVNLYFTRDIMMIIDEFVSISHMTFEAREKETLLVEYIFKYHNDYNHYHVYKNEGHIEGGDILNLNENTLLIGISERSSLESIKKLSTELFKYTNIKTVLAVKIAEKHECMHLDTLITQITDDCFVMYKKEFIDSRIYEITKNTCVIKNDTLEELLTKYLQKNIKFIYCNNKIEQYNDGVNTLAIDDNTIIVYNCNNQINDIYRKQGINVIEIDGQQLGIGRGGPHCMSQPLLRRS